MIAKLKSLWLLLTSKNYYIVSNKGTVLWLPENEQVLEALLIELDNLDHIVSECLDDIRLREY